MDLPKDLKVIAHYRKNATQLALVSFIFLSTGIVGAYFFYRNFVMSYSPLFSSIAGCFTLGCFYFAFHEAKHMRLNFQYAAASFYARRCHSLFSELVEKGRDYDWTNFLFAKKNFLGFRGGMFSRYRFWRASDLAEYEKSLIDYLISFRRAQELVKQEEKRRNISRGLLRRFILILRELQVSSEEERSYVQDFCSYKNPNRQKEFIDTVCSRIVTLRWRKDSGLFVAKEGRGVISQDSVREDVHLKSMALQASKVSSEEAVRLYEEGLRAELRRDKIRLFGQALAREEKFDNTPEAGEAPATPGQKREIVREVRHISLQGFVRERFQSLEQICTFPEWKMRREIIISLLEPGRSGGRFNKHYFAEDTVKKMVRRQYEMYADETFDVKCLNEAISHLLSIGVLVTKPKTDERTISLSTRTKVNSKEASEIVTLVLKVKRELAGIS